MYGMLSTAGDERLGRPEFVVVFAPMEQLEIIDGALSDGQHAKVQSRVGEVVQLDVMAHGVGNHTFHADGHVARPGWYSCVTL